MAELKPLGADKWGNQRHPYKFTKNGWACNYCGGMFRGLKSLTQHQQDKHSITPAVTE